MARLGIGGDRPDRSKPLGVPLRDDGDSPPLRGGNSALRYVLVNRARRCVGGFCHVGDSEEPSGEAAASAATVGRLVGASGGIGIFNQLFDSGETRPCLTQELRLALIRSA